MTVARLPTLKPRIATLNTRRTGMAEPTVDRTPWGGSASAPLRLRGRALQTRNNRIKARDLYTCQECGIVTTELEVDHRIPISQGGSDDDTNLQCLCVNADGTGCHAAKSKRESRGG